MSGEFDSTLSAVATDLETVLRDHEGWTDAEVLAIQPFGSGHSGFTYAVDLAHAGATSRYVLRLSRPDVRIAGPTDVGRQGRIMGALAAAGAPAPRVIACDSRPAVDGRAFALMDMVDGHGWEVEAAETSHGQVAEAALEALACFQSLDVAATGLGEEHALRPREELARWAALLERCPVNLIAAGRRLADDLATTAPPATARPVLVHGDYHYGNLVFAGRRVAAVVDWEIAQVGEPLLDLGCLAVASIRRRYPDDPNPTGGLDVAPADIVARYGADSELAAWFVALTCFKYTAILGYNAELHRRGKRPDPIYDQLSTTIDGLLDDGARVLAGGLDAALPAETGA